MMQQKLSKLSSAFSESKCLYVSKNDSDIFLHDVCKNIKIKIDKDSIDVLVEQELIFSVSINQKTYNKLVVLYYLYKYTNIIIFVKRIVTLILKLIKR